MNTQTTTLLENGWSLADECTKDLFRGATFMRQMGGGSSPYVTYDMTVSKSDDGKWIPIHGSVHMEPVADAVEAALVLMRYWQNLPDQHKLRWDRVKQPSIVTTTNEGSETSCPQLDMV